MKQMTVLVFVLCILLPAPALPQIHENVSVDLVNVYLSATDSKGRFVTDLKPEELTLREDGVIQMVSSFSNFAKDKTSKLGEAGVPLSVAFVIDTSDSMRQQLTGGQQKIDIVKTRMINSYGYCEVCATDVLNFVASIFARGDVKREARR